MVMVYDHVILMLLLYLVRYTPFFKNTLFAQPFGLCYSTAASSYREGITERKRITAKAQGVARTSVPEPLPWSRHNNTLAIFVSYTPLRSCATLLLKIHQWSRCYMCVLSVFVARFRQSTNQLKQISW